jgi:hypothetical protein
MVVKTQFMVVRVEELAGVGRNDANEMFLIFRSGSTQKTTYKATADLEADFKRLTDAMDGRMELVGGSNI